MLGTSDKTFILLNRTILTNNENNNKLFNNLLKYLSAYNIDERNNIVNEIPQEDLLTIYFFNDILDNFLYEYINNSKYIQNTKSNITTITGTDLYNASIIDDVNVLCDAFIEKLSNDNRPILIDLDYSDLLEYNTYMLFNTQLSDDNLININNDVVYNTNDNYLFNKECANNIISIDISSTKEYKYDFISTIYLMATELFHKLSNVYYTRFIFNKTDILGNNPNQYYINLYNQIKNMHKQND